MPTVEDEIKEIVNRETQAWNTKDVNLLLSIFHKDFVWVWPKNNTSQNPIDWELPMGKYNESRWRKVYQDIFSKYQLVKNIRNITDIKISEEKDGAFAVVDIDTLWEDKEGKQMHWLGRVGKTYVNVDDEWKLISHFGVLRY